MSESTVTRRGLLRAGGAVAVGAAALSTTGTAAAQSSYDGWLDDVGNFDGTVIDATGQDSVTIEVGVQGNNGPNAFGPPAVQVNPGTTVVWEWVEGGHNVVDENGAFESPYTDESGTTFEYTPDATGVIKYFCAPHRSLGMKGVLEVIEGSGSGVAPGSGGGGSGGDGGGDASSGNGGSSGGTGGEEGAGDGSSAETPSVSGPAAGERMGSTGDGVIPGLVVTALAVAFVSPALFAAFLKNRDVGDEAEGTPPRT